MTVFNGFLYVLCDVDLTVGNLKCIVFDIKLIVFYLDLYFRSTHCVVVFDGFLYAVGGNDGSTSLSSVERYSPRTNKWEMVSPMTMRRSSVATAVLDMIKPKATWVNPAVAGSSNYS